MDVNTATEENVNENRVEDDRANGDDKRKVDEEGQNKLMQAESLPLLLEDSTLQTLPAYVQKLLNQINLENATQNDLLAVLAYCISLETGFALTDIKKDFYSFWGFSFHSNNINMLAKLPDEYCEIKDSVYKFNLKLLNYSNKRTLLLCLRTGDSFCITLTPENSPGRSICLSIGRYVLSPKITNIAGKFRNLQEFSYLLKDNVFAPIRNNLMEESELPYPGLAGIPTEVLVIILKQMKLNDIQSLSKTCWKMRVPCVNYYEKMPKHPALTPSKSSSRSQLSELSFDLIY